MKLLYGREAYTVVLYCSESTNGGGYGVLKTVFLMVVLTVLNFSAALSYTGEAGPPMFSMIYGSRALSLGGAALALSDHIYYMDSNPAAGDTNGIYRVSLLHQEWIADVNYESMRFAGSVGGKIFFGAGFTYLYFPFTYYDILGSDRGTYNLSQSLGIVNAGYRIARLNLSVGGNFKVYYNHVPGDLVSDQSFVLFAVDLGLLKNTDIFKTYVGPEHSLSFGFVLKNVGFSQYMEKLPTQVHAGVAYRPVRHLLISTEIAVPLYEPVFGAVGVEYDFEKMFFLTGGAQIKTNPMLSLGIGYRRRDLQINVSYTPTIAFYNMMSISLTYSFGASKKKQREAEIEALLTEALKLFGEKRYEEALSVVNRILEMDPKNTRALRLKEMIITMMELKERLDKILKERE